MFNLKTGSYRSLEQTFLDDLTALKRSDPLASVLVVTPSGQLRTHLQRQCATRDAECGLNTQFLTFYALAERLLADSAYTERLVTEPALYQELIRDILSGDHPEPIDLEIRKGLRLRDRPIPQGLAGALSETLKDLRDSGLRADIALQAAKEGYLGDDTPEAATTLALYTRLVGLFEKHQLRSTADYLRRAAKHAPAHPWITSQKAIFIYGFYDLTGVQLDLVLSLADHPNAHVYFPHVKENAAYAYAEKLLKDPAFLSKCALSSSPAVSGRGSMDSRPTTAGNDGGGVKTEVFSCSGAHDETWLAAKEILRLRDEGIAFHDIAVVARNLTGYLSPLREIFSANAIPFVCTRNAPAGTHPMLKGIRTLLKPGSTPKPDPDSDTETSWPEHIAWAKSLITTSVQAQSHPTEEESMLLAMVFESLDALEILDVIGKSVSREHFLKTWQEKAEKLERPGSAIDHEGVRVLEVQEARGLPFEAVFALGMNEKVFPRLIREDPFLPDAARAKLAQTTGCRLGKKLDGYEEERLLFALVKASASRFLYLLTQRSDSEGKALIPSVYLKEIEHETGTKPRRVARGISEKFEKMSLLLASPKELSFLINRATLDPKALYQALGWDSASFYKSLAVHRALETFKSGVGAYDGKVEASAELQKALSKPFSPSGLEDLAQCPFQYYAGHVLRINPKEDLAPGGEMTPIALGKLFHRTLELYYKTPSLEEALKACFKEYKEDLSAVYPLALKSSKDTINKELSSFIKSELEEQNESGFRPRWFEQPLEGTLPIANLTQTFYGKPDRLDIRDEAGKPEVRVVDYKSGKPKSWTGRIETHLIQGKFLQLPVYLGLAAAFATNALGKAVTAVNATLRPVRETAEDATEKTLEHAYWGSPAAALFAKNINELLKLAQEGNFYIEPSTGEWGYCTRCHFALVCRKEHMPTRLRAEHDASRLRVRHKLDRIAPKETTVRVR